jgi:hypothetical protein
VPLSVVASRVTVPVCALVVFSVVPVETVKKLLLEQDHPEPVVAVVRLTANVYSAVVVVLVCAATEISEAVVIPLEEVVKDSAEEVGS